MDFSEDAIITNKKLFSRHYLSERIRNTSYWKGIGEDEVLEAFEELEEIYEDQKDLLEKRKSDEEGLRSKFITPILERVLGFEQEKEKTGRESSETPDYALYRNSENAKKAVRNQDYYKYSIGLVEAKPYEANLERKKKSGGQATQNNPTRQIVDYLIENKPQWGILTNGKEWRLVHREASNRLDEYFRVDLIELFEKDISREERIEKFKFFYALFSREAFLGKEGEKVLDEVKDESQTYAQEIGDDLEENIYNALEWMAKGYIQNQSNEGIEDEPIENIREHSLILLYRLLFAFYADARGLLGNPKGAYDSYNFSELVEEVCDNIDEGHSYGKTGLIGTQLWEIFDLIDKGSKAKGIPEEEAKIPAYNGGLFDDEKIDSEDREKPFFEEYNIHDEYWAKIIDLVARTERGEDDGRSRVDYYDLSIRHLGGIYEGLLEYQLRREDEDYVEVKDEGAKKAIPVSEAEGEYNFADDDIIPAGEPFLVTEKNERKATGSYYTPDYIVDYIIRENIEPVIEEKISQNSSDEEIAEAILNTKVLDPAMGSGHFLVDAIELVASELVKYTELSPDEAKRKVAKNCIYGVDVNNLATELAKVSVWLTTISEDKPLSFLDHHLRTGNSLLGADIHNVDSHPTDSQDDSEMPTGQTTLATKFASNGGQKVKNNLQEMLEMFKEIQEQREDAPEDIQSQKEIYERFRKFPFRQRFEILSDVYTSYYFDNKFSKSEYEELTSALKKEEDKSEEDSSWKDVVEKDFVQDAVNSEHNFFHWKLAFPEVFFDIQNGEEKDNPGFDAVVGNPPYVNVGELPDEVVSYLIDTYDYAQKRVDLYVAFIEKSLELTKEGGYHSFIIPEPFLTQDYAEELRINLLDYDVQRIVDLSDYDVFEDAEVDNIIPIIRNGSQESLMEVLIQDEDPNEVLEVEGRTKEINPEHFTEMFKHMFRLELNEEILSLKSKLDEQSFRLGYGFAGSWGARGIPTDEYHFEEKVNEKCEKLVKGKDVHRFFVDYNDRWFLYDYDDLYRPAFPELFENPKIMVPEVTGEEGIIAAVDRDNYYTDHSICNCVKKTVLTDKSDAFLNRRKIEVTDEQVEFVKNYNLEYVAGILNSKLLNFYFRNLVGYDLNVYPESVEYLPIKENPPEEKQENIGEKYSELQEKKEEFYQEVHSFLKWIEREWGCDIDNLSLKTHLREYWEYEFSEMLRIAKKNSSKINGNPSDRKFQEKIESEFQDSKEKLESLQGEIDSTLEELNSEVFNLYGVGAEEIEMITE